MKRDGKSYRYMVRFYVKGERFYLGCFKTVKEAKNAIEKWQKGNQCKGYGNGF